MGKKKEKTPVKEQRLMIAIPAMDTVPTLFAKSLLSLRITAGTPFGFAMSSLVYDARNSLVLDAINGGFDRILWLDSDMIFEPDLIDQLWATMDKTGADLVTGLYVTRKLPIEPVLYKRCEIERTEKEAIFHIDKYYDYPKNSVFPIAACGFGGVLMTVDMAKKMVDKYGTAFAPLPGLGEDLSFCLRANESGFKMVCDSSVKLEHIGYVPFAEEDYDNFRRAVHE